MVFKMVATRGTRAMADLLTSIGSHGRDLPTRLPTAGTRQVLEASDSY